MSTPRHPWSDYEAALLALEEERSKSDAPSLVLKLRKRFPLAEPSELHLAVETFVARRQAPEKLGAWADKGHFSLSILQQASRESIATFRAARFQGRNHILEIGTGTGSDTAALARVARHVTTIEGDAERAELARRNLALLGVSNVTVLVGEAQALIPTLTTPFDALFADPARRKRSGERVSDGEEYSPSLSYLLGLSLGDLRAIKVSPGLFVEPPPEGWAREFVGHGDECLDQTLWFGSSVTDSSVAVPDRGATWSPAPGAASAPIAQGIEDFLVEAHPTLNRSQKLPLFFAELGIKLISDGIAYGTSPTPPAQSPLIESFRVLESLPYSLKALKPLLSSRGWTNRTELKKRGFTGELEEIRKALTLPKHTHGAPFGVVFFFRYHGKPWAVVAERLYGR